MKFTLELKKVLFDACMEYVEKKFSLQLKAMTNAQQAANQETKSSFGDKYETGRAMMHLEKDKYARQLSESANLKKILSQIDYKKEYKSVQPGCVVGTNQGYFFICISADEIIIENEEIIPISLVSPLGQELRKKEKGTQFNFRNVTYVINEVL